MAEGVTYHGRVAIQWIARKLNEYINGIMKTDNFDYVLAIDTDSVLGESLIYVNNKKIRIDEYYELAKGDVEYKGKDNYIKHITADDTTLSFSNKVNEKRINYIMKHKVKKQMYNIEFNGNNVTITEDHSLMVLRKDKLISIKINEIKETDKLVAINT